MAQREKMSEFVGFFVTSQVLAQKTNQMNDCFLVMVEQLYRLNSTLL